MYSPIQSWILLIDARDTIFQLDPFGRVPRRAAGDDNDDNDGGGGTLIFFGENADVTSLGKSKHNRRWLQLAYGDDVANALYKKPTICSGSTIGQQVAIETYLRAMVSESDESKTVIFGADQGFHNYLYYSNKLSQAKTIDRIIVQDQGLGIVNNLGALREHDITKWGNGKLLRTIVDDGNDDGTKIIQKKKKKNVVFNWDGTISPIVHQYDRHKVLSRWWLKDQMKEFKAKWNDMKNK